MVGTSDEAEMWFAKFNANIEQKNSVLRIFLISSLCDTGTGWSQAGVKQGVIKPLDTQL